MDDIKAIAKLIDALRPWHKDIVIAGGWAYRLYRFHNQAANLSYLPLRTRDADVVFNSRNIKGDIGEALERAGFQEVLAGNHVPPVSEYRLGDEDEGFYVEFLVPLRGSENKRDGTPDATMYEAGITAQKLRHLDILLNTPWSLHIDKGIGIPVARPVNIQIPNPVSFIVQKLLIQNRRAPEKRSQDILYIHDTLELFSGELDSLHEIWAKNILPALPKRTVQRLGEECHRQFDAVNDVIRNAVRIPQDRSINPERLRAVCAYGLETVLATS